MPDSVWMTAVKRLAAFLLSIVLLVVVLPLAIIVWALWAIAQFLLLIVTRDDKWADSRSFQPARGLFGWFNHNLQYAFFGVQQKPEKTVMIVPDLRG